MKKKAGLFIVLGILLFLNSIYSLDLEIISKPVQDSFIVELNDSAIFDITIKNNGAGTKLKMYTAVGIDIIPSEEFFINKDEEKTIRVNLIPQESLKQNKGPLIFEYIIQDNFGNTKIGKLNINIISLADIFSITAGDLTPESKKIDLKLKNILSKEINDFFIKMDSAFFQYQTNISLKPNEERLIEVPLNTERIKTIDAGQYIITTQMKLNNKIGQKDVLVNFLGQENIQEQEIKSGFFIRKTEIIRKNNGNLKKVVNIAYEKDIFSAVFTSINIPPTRTSFNFINKGYLWEKELSPGQELKIIMETKWIYPILAILLIIIFIYFIKRYIETDLLIKKRIYYVKTMGGEFALRVHLKVKAKRFVSKIKIIDKIPPLVTLYDKFGAITPDKIDLANKKLEWDVESLHPGEEKVFSYIIYSKIGVVGKFELPPTRAVYDREGIMKSSFSNKSFFVNKPKYNKM